MTRNRSPEQQQAHDDWVQRAGQIDIVRAAVRLGAKLKKSSGAWAYRGPCPAPGCGGNDRFALNTLKKIFNCRGCGRGGDVISMTMAIGGMSFLQACEELTGEPCPSGPAKPLSEADKAERNRQRLANDEAQRRRQEQEAAYQEDTREAAARIFGGAASLFDTLGEKYLNSRGIPTPENGWPQCLRFQPALPYPGKPGLHPALICCVDDIGEELCAVWRIFLRSDGRKMDVPNPKLGLGPAGGGAVRIGGNGRKIGLAEGLESALGAWNLIDRKYPVWAALSTSGMIGIELPLGVEHVVIFPDGDASMRKHGSEYVPAVPAGRKAAQALRSRLLAEGVACTIAAEPPAGKDYADMWIQHARETA